MLVQIYSLQQKIVARYNSFRSGIGPKNVAKTSISIAKKKSKSNSFMNEGSLMNQYNYKQYLYLFELFIFLEKTSNV